MKDNNQELLLVLIYLIALGLIFVVTALAIAK